MTESDNGREGREILKQLQQELAVHDPAVLEMDLDDPDTRLGFVLMAAVLKGSSVSLTFEEGDRTETMQIDKLATTETGEHMLAIGISSSDGTLSEDGANVVADLLAESHAAEIDQLLNGQ